MIDPTDVTSTRYRIGAVAKLTGIAPDTLRIWERRYAAVTPQRSPRGGRLYSAGDLGRLRMMKLLVDAGDAIGEIAGLDTETLRDRLAQTRHASPDTGPTPLSSCRLTLVGESLASILEVPGGTLTGITLVAAYRDTADFEARASDDEADVLVIEQATLHADSAARLVDWLVRAKATRAVVIYRYASREALAQLPASRCSALSAPVDPRTLQAHCLAMWHTGQPVSTPAAAGSAGFIRAAPPRRYDDAALAQLASLSSTVKCECPRHLAELITSLSAFERYSVECENRSSRDAALHTYLHASASHARQLIEEALDHVIEMENIKIRD
jgi:DNA-binding transcriptional MerR regulator